MHKSLLAYWHVLQATASGVVQAALFSQRSFKTPRSALNKLRQATKRTDTIFLQFAVGLIGALTISLKNTGDLSDGDDLLLREK